MLALQAELTSLKRRVGRLEVLNFGRVKKHTQWPLLQMLYVEACTGNVYPSVDNVTPWAANISLMDEEILLDIGRAAGDPFPWRCFLLVLDRFTDQGFDVKEPTEHLLDIARSLLRMQGLGKVDPEQMLLAETNPFAKSYQP